LGPKKWKFLNSGTPRNPVATKEVDRQASLGNTKPAVATGAVTVPNY
jgi:hypothetical protein